MSIKSKVFAAAAALTVIGGAGAAGALSATSAWASSPGCAFSNGCATLHGLDAASNAVAMDAKHQSAKPGTLIIGYPDVPGDGATSFDAVLHYTTGAKKVTYQDTGLTVTDFEHTCFALTSLDLKPVATPGSASATGAITAGGNDLSVSTNPSDLSISGGGTGTLNWTAKPGPGGALVIAENYGSGCVGLWSATVSNAGSDALVGSFSAVSQIGGGFINETNTGSSVDTFTDTVPGGTFSFTGLPAGVSQAGGILTADTSTAIPGTYTSIGVVYKTPGGAIDTASFDLVVSGVKSTSPGNDIPFYTFAYAKGGVWSNECVTDNNGSGGLVLEACTLGKDRYQDFFALNAGTPVLSDTGAVYIQDWMASATNAADSCLTDPSSLNPATPQSDATDELTSPAGRQLRVDGSCSASANMWTWAS